MYYIRGNHICSIRVFGFNQYKSYEVWW